MSAHAEILRLFKSLSEQDRISVLAELDKAGAYQPPVQSDQAAGSCPYCESKLFIKHGKRNGTQKYKCKGCCKIFTLKTGTSFHRIQKREKFELFKSLMLEAYYPIRQMAGKVGITVQTAFDWRHKVLSGMAKDDVRFKGTTEIDDIWFLYSQKGRKGLKYSRKRGGSKRAGDNDFQAKLLITSDRNKTTDMSLVRIGRLKKEDMVRKLSGRFSEGCTLVSDKHRSIGAFAKYENLAHVSFKAADHTAGGDYHVQNVNNMAVGLKNLINRSLRGVSTKYLQNYANWFKLRNEKMNLDEMERSLGKEKNLVTIHVNRESIYKGFIAKYSKRTYRCPVVRSFRTALNDETLAKLNLI